MRAAAAALTLALAAAAETPPTAREIMEEVARRSSSKTYRYDGHVTVRRANGAAEEKTWRYERMGAPGNSKAMLRFTAPADIRGVALLIWNHPGKAADMWLYTPALAVTRRIARQDRSSRFAGTGFRFEDIEEDDVAQWDYSDLQSIEESGEACWRLAARRREGRKSGHDRNWLWIGKAKMTPLRIDKFRGEAVRSRLQMRSLTQIQGIWTPLVVEVTDLADRSRTTLELTGVHYDIRMSDAGFTLEALRGLW